MSRAFIKEDSEDPDALPERPQSSAPNYVTPCGLDALRRKARELREKLGAVSKDSREGRIILRELAYYDGRVARAIPVDAAGRPGDEIRFGAKVLTRDLSGLERRFEIVGQDEAEEGGEKISWDSPPALAMRGLRVGAQARWEGPDGPLVLTIFGIEYPKRGSAGT